MLPRFSEENCTRTDVLQRDLKATKVFKRFFNLLPPAVYCKTKTGNRLENDVTRVIAKQRRTCHVFGAQDKVKVKVQIKINVKLSLCLTKHHAMKAYRGVEV
jgi:hypothetical protein